MRRLLIILMILQTALAIGQDSTQLERDKGHGKFILGSDQSEFQPIEFLREVDTGWNLYLYIGTDHTTSYGKDLFNIVLGFRNRKLKSVLFNFIYSDGLFDYLQKLLEKKYGPGDNVSTIVDKERIRWHCNNTWLQLSEDLSKNISVVFSLD